MNKDTGAIPARAKTWARQVKRAYTSLVQHRFIGVALFDGAIWSFSLIFAIFLRYNFTVPGHAWSRVWVALPLVAAAQLTLGTVEGIYLGRWRLGSFEEVAALLKTVFFADLLLAVVNEPWRMVPMSVIFIAPAIALLMMAGARYSWRLMIERKKRPGAEAARLIVYGAGDGAAQIITAMMRDPNSPYRPVAIVDDDPRKRNLRIRGVPVLGSGRDVARLAAKVDADTLLIAIPSSDGSLIRELSDLAMEAGLKVKVLPPVGELIDGQVGVSDIRVLTIADLLGRREIDTDVNAIADYLTGRRVLVTGAGGSIGSELCRQITRFAPAELVMLDRDESALHAVSLSIDGRALLDDPNLVVCDIRDRHRINEVFEAHRPDVVFHAAALKHLPLLEMHPTEALKTNVWGTQHVLDASRALGVARFVNISTDKAADPCSVLGYTKRITERLAAHADDVAPGDYLSVRFGNVLGSRGSVLTSFWAQIEAGGPVTVTDANATRYFMTVEEAVQLVIQAGAIGDGGDVLVLDMGEPVRIDTVARQLVEQAERPIDIVYTGLRPAEKLHEVLFGAGEQGDRRHHPLISHVAVSPLAPELLSIAIADPDDASCVVRELRSVCCDEASLPS